VSTIAGAGVEAPVIRRVVLIGFMCSGKSSVGRELARTLGWEFRDFDEEIESAAGMTIPEIFAEEGESGFRAREAAVGADLLLLERVVLATGGGWPVPSGTLEGLLPDSVTVWLRVGPQAVLERARKLPGSRPLLQVPDPMNRVLELLAEREPRYRLADLALDSEPETPQRLARRIADWMASRQTP
jgi:shikimate kinase